MSPSAQLAFAALATSGRFRTRSSHCPVQSVTSQKRRKQSSCRQRSVPAEFAENTAGPTGCRRHLAGVKKRRIPMRQAKPAECLDALEAACFDGPARADRLFDRPFAWRVVIGRCSSAPKGAILARADLRLAKSFKFITQRTAESVTIGRRKSVKDGCKEPITAREDVMSTTVAALRETL
jgi:hypothetical protein